ncbi:uncharacterized protein EI97DRAFT_494979 [Westerdykella ornata]|uniref:2-dehydropantoate 2-reductase n=1 Tax=Westerdykella ornata TaxID=318751 RepID=A0A6A6JFN8_WESOR|nr:uncharacterized protein EI97DRAFT_494979 [Westerdykella ornata]KAF2275085.1 hypothetical protein EI97DRAFT_494979 [Westerdykella ornata]
MDNGGRKENGLSRSPYTERNLRTALQFYRRQRVVDRRIHVLGMGSLGLFVAHSLRKLPNPPPVTLMFHAWQTLDTWNQSSRTIKLVTDDTAERTEGFDAELSYLRRRFHGKEIEEEIYSNEAESTEPISSLIVCTKTQMVLQALSRVKHRLHKESVILFLQNGMGTIEEVNREIFPDPETRPRYMLGTNTHHTSLHPDEPFVSLYKGYGTLAVAILPSERDGGTGPYTSMPRFGPASRMPLAMQYPEEPDLEAGAPQQPGFHWTPNHRYLLRTLLRSTLLSATGFSPPDLLQMQLERLAINSIIGPLTVMLDARNGSILYNYSLTRTMRLLLAEISLVIRSLPELRYIPNIPQRFDPGRLETLVVGVANRTKDEISMMLRDVRRGRLTEVEYLNGWIVKKGEELGVRCFMNYMMVNLVKGKANMIQMEMNEEVPLLPAKAAEGPIVLKGEAQEASSRDPLEDDD